MMQELKMRRSAQISDGGFTQKRRFFRVCLGAGFQTLFRRVCIRKRNGNGKKVFGPFLRGFVECVRFS